MSPILFYDQLFECILVLYHYYIKEKGSIPLKNIPQKKIIFPVFHLSFPFILMSDNQLTVNEVSVSEVLIA